MKEFERIIGSGLISADYIKEERVCDYLITTDKKKLFIVLLDLLCQFDKVCRKHNLTYFLCGGTLLGAIRHNGFIPWDDDVDVEMPREDYEKFIRLYDEFQKPYFLETPYTDQYYAYSHARLINDNTTALNRTFAFQPMHHGVWMSIFPVDRWKEEDIESFKKIDRLNSENSTYMRLTNPWLDDKNMKRVQEWSGRDPIDVYEEIVKIATQYNTEDTKYMRRIVVTALGFLQLYYAEDFSSYIEHDFQGYSFHIPVGYDRMLQIKYGNYLELPPVNKRGLWHSDMIFDPDTPYEEFVELYKNTGGKCTSKIL